MRCPKCSVELIGAKKFCASCGAAIPAAADGVVLPRPVDPFASTVRPDDSLSARSISPLASSSIDLADTAHAPQVKVDSASPSVAPAPAPPSKSKQPKGTQVMQQVAPMARPVPHQPPPPAPPSAAPPQAAAPAPSPALAAGQPVRVLWANGQRYPGTVWQVQGSRVLVAFPDGQQHWVELGYVERA